MYAANFALDFCSVTKVSFVLALFYSSQTRHKGMRILIGFVVLFGIKLRELLTDNPTDPFKEPQAAIWSILACNRLQELEQSRQKEAKATEQREDDKSDEQTEDVQLDPQEDVESDLQKDMQSDLQKDVQSDEESETKGDDGSSVQSEEQGIEDDEFAEGSGAENESGKTDELPFSARGCRKRQISSAQVPEDGGEPDETSG